MGVAEETTRRCGPEITSEQIARFSASERVAENSPTSAFIEEGYATAVQLDFVTPVRNPRRIAEENVVAGNALRRMWLELDTRDDGFGLFALEFIHDNYRHAVLKLFVYVAIDGKLLSSAGLERVFEAAVAALITRLRNVDYESFHGAVYNLSKKSVTRVAVLTNGWFGRSPDRCWSFELFPSGAQARSKAGPVRRPTARTDHGGSGRYAETRALSLVMSYLSPLFPLDSWPEVRSDSAWCSNSGHGFRVQLDDQTVLTK
jgi:hypothetical protein